MSVNIVQDLIKYYYNGYLNFSLKDEDVKELTWEFQETFIKATLNSPRLKKYPMNPEFCRLFFKKFIDALESKQEIHDEIYAALCKSMKISSEYFYYRHYLINNNLDDIITIKETRNMVVNGTTGLRTWQAALMLADFALNHKKEFKNKIILELGSGVGFTGIVIAKYCNIHSILLTDCHEEVLETIRENININFTEAECTDETLTTPTIVKHKIGVKYLDWNCIEDFPTYSPDILIGADIIYDPSIIKPLCNVLKTFFDLNKSLDVYIANIIRNVDTYKLFLDSIDEINLKWKEIPLEKSVCVDWDNSVQKCLLKING